MKDKRLLESLNLIDDKYIKEAEPKMKTSTIPLKKIIGSVACFVIVIAISLYLFIPFRTGPDVRKYEGSEYYPLIASIADFRYKPSKFKNNYQVIANDLSSLFDGNFDAKDNAAVGGNLAAAPGNNAAPDTAPGDKGESNNSEYVEVTDNQVDGVIEADIVKRTSTHVFRLGMGGTLYVYTINKENSEELTKLNIPVFEDERHSYYYNFDMYLSADGNDLTIIKPYNDKNYKSKVGIISIDVSDPENTSVSNKISIDGSYNSSRMVDGKLLLISEYVVTAKNIDYSKPETYVPSITKNGVTESVKFKDIIYPEKLTNLRYSMVALMNEGSLELVGANALLCFNGEIYVSNENVYITRGYTTSQRIADKEGSYFNIQTTDIAVIKYSDGTLKHKGILTVEGTVKDQYSMDEYEGHFRVVTSTSKVAVTEDRKSDISLNDTTASMTISDTRRSASLTVFNLESFTKIAEVRNFAPEGEEAASVRFDGDKAYVCTAVVITFTDPVFYFDLSDYSNITYTDTGVIDGFSSSLIQLGDGYLLGIGQENRTYSKVEVYEEVSGSVVSVDKYLFDGSYSTDYKSYFIDRESDMFGFAAEYLYTEDRRLGNYYILLVFNGYELVEVVKLEMEESMDAVRVRAFMDDGYLYITDDYSIKAVNIGE